jgi:cytochrome b pre-mRNA-processing protein 3
VGWWGRLIGDKREEALPLYNAVVVRGRAEHWYLDGAVPDTVDGRFDMIAAVLTMVLLRLEDEPLATIGKPRAPSLSAHLTERFVDDMDGQLRQLGVGDVVVGKHVGKMMSMLGGRLGAYREALAASDLAPALLRNLYRGQPPEPAALTHVATALTAFHAALAATSLDQLTAGDLP